MRKITDHKVNGLNEALEIHADERGTGNASHHYRIFIPDSVELKPGVTVHVDLSFQNGPIGEAGFNGISNEALLAVVADRLRGFQEGPFKCRDNAIALTHIEDALMRLHKRTRDRMARGVEGTHTV